MRHRPGLPPDRAGVLREAARVDVVVVVLHRDQQLGTPGTYRGGGGSAAGEAEVRAFPVALPGACRSRCPDRESCRRSPACSADVSPDAADAQANDPPTGGEPLAAPRRPSAPARTGHEGPQPAVSGRTAEIVSSRRRTTSRRWSFMWSPWRPALAADSAVHAMWGATSWSARRWRARPTWRTQLRVGQRSPPGSVARVAAGHSACGRTSVTAKCWAK